ncbi:MAG: hypothetical protein FWE41_09125, partial [Coriobacteriia bacterium]|nr:hypothetical protein [Coriobacteriia bacterium]
HQQWQGACVPFVFGTGGGTGGGGLVWYRGWYRGDGVSVPIWPKGQIGTLPPSPLYHTKPRPPVPPSPVPLFHHLYQN